MKTLQTTTLIVGLAASALAGPDALVDIPAAPAPSDPFADVRRPISNPVRFDLALPRTNIHAIYMHHKFPGSVELANGSDLDFGGDLNLFAVQAELALTERFSIVAAKDGYIDFNPDSSFSDAEGFANLAAGVKYAFIYKPETQYVMSGSAIIELPTGNRDVFQGEGDGSIHLSVTNLKMWDKWQFASGAGVEIPFDDAFSTTGFVSAHLSYEVSPWFIPLVEVNWFTVLDEGDGASRFTDQVGGAVPGLATFEGADLINFGSANGGDNDYATVAVGFRSRITETLDVGFAYEVPLTDEGENITEERFTLDATITF